MQRYVTLTREQALNLLLRHSPDVRFDLLEQTDASLREQTLDDQVGPLTQVAGAPSSPSLRDVQRELEAAHEARRKAEDELAIVSDECWKRLKAQEDLTKRATAAEQLAESRLLEIQALQAQVQAHADCAADIEQAIDELRRVLR